MTGDDILYCMEVMKKGIRSKRNAGKIASGKLLLRGAKWQYVVLGWCINFALLALLIGLIKLIV
jgi:hypothetical protein